MIDIVKYPWHTGHDYELLKIPHRFQIVNSTHRDWASNARPFPDNVSFINNIDDSEASLMIMHVDQWIFDEPDKLQLFKKMDRRFKGKKIVINHGCNIVDGATSTQMQSLIGDYTVVCNSSTAEELWQLPNSHYIHHGMTPSEWDVSNYGHSNILVIQPFSKMHEDCRNGRAALKFEEQYDEQITWIGRDKKFKTFGAYKSFLASSSIAFFPSYASANPRSRTECMFSGLAVVTTNTHGESRYIVNEENGYASNNMRELYEYLIHLKNSPDEVRRLGRNARITAEKEFHSDRFIREWLSLIDNVTNNTNLHIVQAQ